MVKYSRKTQKGQKNDKYSFILSGNSSKYGKYLTHLCVTGARLHIIKPIGFEISDRTLKRAGLDYWDKLDVTYYENYEDFLAKNPTGKKYYFSAHGTHSYAEAEYPDGVYLIFGRESVGLPKELIEENADNTLRIPMRKTLRCLNLSNSVAI